jgi:hypothetical protein
LESLVFPPVVSTSTMTKFMSAKLGKGLNSEFDDYRYFVYF